MPEEPPSFTITVDLLKVFRPLEAQSGDIHDRSYKPFKSQQRGSVNITLLEARIRTDHAKRIVPVGALYPKADR